MSLKKREDIDDEAWSGRRPIETTFEHIEEICSLINNDPHVTIDEMEVQTGFSHGTIHRIISDYVRLKNMTTRYVPKQLADSQRAERVRIRKKTLTEVELDAWRLYDAITCNESRFCHKKIGRKLSNVPWVSEENPLSTVVRQSRFARKILFSIFFKSSGPVLIHYVERG
ncbi:unnamed protein product [Adineta ricciae]|uniref:Transposase n=1 Tax=Adineta ricciae TaxID=249248 RepID=A0A815JY37_ADIRI|nr:unnamed protein product [Adineta ricciae]CAF1502624.1 unnamed protein product [Adineta ricciae]